MARIDMNDAVLVVIDIQEKLFARVHDREKVLKRMVMTIDGSKIYNLPILVTEQNPEGLGPTVKEVEDALPIFSPERKRAFCAFDCHPFEERFEQMERHTVILIGIETHICILMTALEALERGLNVYVVSDAVSSTDPEDGRVALERMRQEGVVVTTSQSILYELIRTAEHDMFRSLLELIKSNL